MTEEEKKIMEQDKYERYVPEFFKKQLRSKLLDVKDKIMDNKDVFTDKQVFGDLLVEIDNATSLREHVK